MQRGERLLVHAAAGGVGQAAIQFAQRAGVEIFATAGSPEKRAFLRSQGIRHVMDSRSVEFGEEIMRITDGEGIDLVLNSLTGPAIPRSIELLRKGGRFLEIGKTEIWDERRVFELNPNAIYRPIDLSKILISDPASMRPAFVQLMAELADGVLKSPPITTFALEDGSNAFRYMAQAKHIGKVVLTQDAEARRPRTLDPDGTYLITGGLGGLGLLTAEWLVKRGARHLVLIGRNPPSADAAETVRQLSAAGADIRIMQGDVSIEEDITSIFDQVQRMMPPLRGVIHAAGMLADGVLLQQDWTRFREVMAAKIEGTWHLHSLTRKMSLDFFVLFSSVSAILGAPGQANHSAANAFMDALAHHRHAVGLPALSINWGVWSEVGAAAERNVEARVVAQGMSAFSPQQGLQVLEHLLAHGPTQIAVMAVNWPKFLSQVKSERQRRFLAAVSNGTAVQTEVVASHKDRIDFRLQLEQAPPKKRNSLLLDYVRLQATKVLSLDATQSIDPKQPLTSLGLDSLMAVELRNLLGSGLRLTRNFPATLVFDYPTLAALTGYLAKEVFGWHEAAQQEVKALASGDTLSNLLENLEDLPEQEVNRLFAERTAGQ
jgi:NADPH:quinone reductase-like Zn-dependent oxidoreductase